MDDLIHEFVAETTEALGLLDQDIVTFEQNPNDAEILSRIFRIMHTIKGTCGFLGLARLEKVAHAGEDVLGKFRDGLLTVSSDAVTLILKCLDRIRELIQALEGAGVEPVGDDSALVNELRAMAENRAPAPVPVAAVAAEAPAQDSTPVLSEGGFPVAQELLDEVAAVEPAPAESAPIESAPAPAVAAAVTAVSVAPVAEKAATTNSNDKGAAGQSIRVGVDVLENLMALVSEMVLTRNQLLQLNRTHGDSPFKGPVQRLNRVTTDLQESVMKTRMQPIGNAWNKLPRIVRDLAKELGKKIDLVMHGEETELDRQVLELIRDPLTHMVRNSADHGLETPADRAAAGKGDTGTIHLSAHHEGGHIIIAIVDDGRGLNTDRIRAKIVERGLASAEELADMDDNQVHQFIMKPGFSTAEKITNVSGRGVGMDVVRSNIEKIGGTLEFRSAWGKGSTFTIKIPLTLAIVSALIVEASGQRFAVPQIAVREVVRATGNAAARIESLSGAPVLRLRDRLLPLINLSSVLKIDTPESAAACQVVVCRSGLQNFGVVVDRIADAEEIVVKPMSNLTKGSGVFSGNTVLGDGTVILILDINTLSQRLMLEDSKAAEATHDAAVNISKAENILLFRGGGDGVKAVALTAVHRIEHFPMSNLEWVQGNPVVQYRNNMLPLLAIDGPAGIRREGNQHVLVFADGNTSVGLAIDSLEDIVSEEVRITSPSRIPGISGSQIVGGRAVDYVDPAYFLASMDAATPEITVLGEAA